MSSDTRTVPYSQTLPRSLRSRSTSMMCSARSLGSRLSSSASASSPWTGRAGPRLGPALPVQGDEALGRRRDQLVVAEVQVPGEGRGIDGAQRLVEVEARQRVDAVQTLRQIGLEDVAAYTYSRVRATT